MLGCNGVSMVNGLVGGYYYVGRCTIVMVGGGARVRDGR